MRVLILNTSEKTGGAAVAANRLMDALNNNGVKAKMLVRDKETDNISVVGLSQSLIQQWRFLWERLVIFFHLHCTRKHLFEIDIANIGTDITKMREFKEADVIHIHWINQGFISLNVIRKILDSGKPVVWTMHDIWPATGICHLAMDCRKYASRCSNCRILPGGGGDKDLSYKVWRKKKGIYDMYDISFVACSKWLASEASRSALHAGHPVTAIPNTLDTRTYCPGDRTMAANAVQLPSDKKVILFVSQRATNPNKGMDFLVEACHILIEKHPDMKDNTVVAVLGGHSEDVVEKIPFKVFPLGYVNDTRRIVDVYRSVDVFVLPSLSENLPNTIMEAMACGVPSVGFRVGGIPEMIDHVRTGYVAKYRDADDLAEGIYWTLNVADRESVRMNCLAKVAACYSQHSVALRYIEVYNQALALKHYRI